MMDAGFPEFRAPAQARSARSEDEPAADENGRRIEASQHGGVRLKARRAVRGESRRWHRQLRSRLGGPGVLFAIGHRHCSQLSRPRSRQNSLNHKCRYRTGKFLIQTLELVSEFVVVDAETVKNGR